MVLAPKVLLCAIPALGKRVRLDMKDFVHCPNGAIFPSAPSHPTFSFFLQPRTDHESSIPGLDPHFSN